MAEAALTSIAKSALQLFTSLAKDEFLLLWNSQKELKRLEATIETISDFLLDAEERKFKDRAVQRCLSDLRKVMYDAEDLFDGLAAHLLRRKTTPGNAFKKEVCLFFSKSNQLGLIVNTAHEVKSLRESLDAISKNMKQFNFIPQQPRPLDQPVERKKTYSYVHQDYIIGRDEDKDRITDMLFPMDKGETSSHRRVSVVAVIGFGGLGKTALAKFVYNDERVKQGFEVHLWACINYLSDMELVLKEIIASKVEKNQLDLSVEMLQEKLRGIIGGKRFLIVLDDVWDKNPENWLDLEAILCCGKRGSKVLVTTRSTKVAECLCALEPYVNLRPLTEEKAWDLFVRRALEGKEISEHPELEPIGKKILSKCGSIPLAIVTVGSLLAQKARDATTWDEFYDNRLKDVFSRDDDNIVKQVLMVIYNDLPPNLKLCFAACSLFPKDYTFDKDHLVRLWLAQGILSAHNKQSLEDVGEAYFFQLVDRCFFQEVVEKYAELKNRFYSGNKENKCTVKMHDLLHDMAIDVAKTENLFLDKVPENKGEIDFLRQISIDFDLKYSFDCCRLVSNPKTLRTFLFHPHRDFGFNLLQDIGLSTFRHLFESFTMLRTLRLPYTRVDDIPESIGGLIHLRYLDLSGNEKIKHLPDSICKLHHLMILVLEGCRHLEKLPQRIEHLVSLRQLFINKCFKMNSLPSGLKSLTSLVNLDRLIVHQRDGGLRYLKSLDNLAGGLQIELPTEAWLDAIKDAKEANMARKNKLKEMVIRGKYKFITASEQRMAKDEVKAVLEALRPHEKLEYLKIDYYSGEMLPTWVCTLRFVKQLYLCNCDNVEYLEDGIKGNLDFPSLRILCIESMRNLKGWRRQEMAQGTSGLQLSTVLSVTIQDCPKLKGQMPLFEAIEYLKLERVDTEVVEELLVPNSSSQSCFSPFHNNSKLKELKLRTIEGLTQLPEGWIRHLTALQILTIEGCGDLDRVSCRGLSYLTALECLSAGSAEIGTDEDDKIGSEAGMPWKALQGLDGLKIGVGNMNLVEGLKYLTSLRQLRIEKWKDVLIGEGEMKGVELPMKALQNLRVLEMGFGNETFHLPKSGILHLHSLNDLKIADCKDLYVSWKTVLGMKLDRVTFERVERVIAVEDNTMLKVEQQSLLHLHSMNSLRIADCKDLYVRWKTLLGMKLDGLELERVERVIDVEDDTMTALEQQSLLRCLYIKKVAGAKWVDDIPWISLSSCLEDLVLRGMGEREQLPDGIQHLTSLQCLKIWGCEKLRSLPIWLPKLTSLTELRIGDCSEELKRRCERGTGEDWPLIRHLKFYITMTRRTNQVKSANESRNEEEEGSRKKGGYCTPCWSPSVKE